MLVAKEKGVSERCLIEVALNYRTDFDPFFFLEIALFVDF